MELDAALELQARLLRASGPGPRAAASAARESGPARRTRDVAPLQPDLALGIAGKAGGGYQLAVRVQRRGLLGGARVAEIVQEARGEADVRYIGRVEKLQGAGNRERRRPLVPGVSVGHRDITAGTLGCFVTTRETGLCMLSNNHVLADENRAAIGDLVLQPARYDGGEVPEDVAGRLAEFVPLQVAGANRVDAALASVAEGIGVEAGFLGDGDALGAEPVAPADVLGERVTKEGRTTGRTSGVVSAFNVQRVLVQYDIAEALRFDGQIEVQGEEGGDFSLGGDSGSLVVTEDGLRPVGLLFAGSDQGGPGGGSVTYVNPIEEVLDLLGAALYLGDHDR